MQNPSTPVDQGCDALDEFDGVLIDMRAIMEVDDIPTVEQVKAWLKCVRGGTTARMLSKLSSLRNTKAHSVSRRIVADAARLAGKAKAFRGSGEVLLHSDGSTKVNQ